MFSSTTEAPQQVRPTASDAAAVSLPAGLYALNNWLVLMTLQSVNVAVFAVLRETNLVRRFDFARRVELARHRGS